MEYPINKLIQYQTDLPNDPSRLIMEGYLGPIYNTWIPKNPIQFLGIEIEVERCIDNVTKLQKIICPTFAHLEQDGSLRNGGVEIITHPIRTAVIETLLTNIYKNLPNTYDFSPRTSIHIHMNIRDLTQKQLLGVIYTYLAVEKLLYNWIGHNRSKSIFCVPLQTTTLSLNLEKIICGRYIKNLPWFKYTGLNLLPIKDLGTIEFRHLYGTDDIPTILTWIGLLQQLFNFAIKYSYDEITQRILSLNSTSEYRIFLEDIFEDKTPTIYYSDFEKDLEFGISFIKNYVFDNPFFSELKNNFSTTSTLYKRLQENFTNKSLTILTNRDPFTNLWTVTPTHREQPNTFQIGATEIPIGITTLHTGTTIGNTPPPTTTNTI